jgi:hypothetical protein
VALLTSSSSKCFGLDGVARRGISNASSSTICGFSIMEVVTSNRGVCWRR